MNMHTDPWETEMSREFDERVRDLHEAPLTLDRVKGRAGRIRRTRRLVAAGGALAAAAVIVPIVVFAGGNLTDDSGPEPAPSPTPDPTVIDPSGTGFHYLEGRTLHRSDGTTLDLPETYRDGAVMGDLFAGVRYDENGEPSLDVVDDEGDVVESHEITTGIAATDDGTTIAYVDRDGVLWTQSDSGRMSIHDGLAPNANPAAVVCGQEDLDCAVWLNAGDGTTPPENVSSHFRLTEVPDALSVGDATESRLVAVMNESLDEGSCGGVYDVASSSYVWEGCESYLYDFSPDDAHLTGTHAYLDGPGPGYITILDAATGDEVARLDPKDGYIGRAVWQDAGHVVVTVFEGNRWSVYRLGVDGSQERLLGPERGDEFDPAYTLLGGS
ncbi:MAG TPA: hypothetical protein VFO49_08970 [Nocardioides sp.]|nr:hypothetical protein [Nocardioides sp.]